LNRFSFHNREFSVAAGPEGAGGFGSCKDSGMALQVIEPLKMDSGKAIAGRERGARLRILAILFGALGAFFIRLIRFETRQSHMITTKPSARLWAGAQLASGGRRDRREYDFFAIFGDVAPVMTTPPKRSVLSRGQSCSAAGRSSGRGSPCRPG
jgi:hypothetical protein